jgi:RHS repeat-associated protein
MALANGMRHGSFIFNARLAAPTFGGASGLKAFSQNAGLDAAGHMTTLGFWQYDYDLDGRLATQTDAKGQQTRFYYNDPNGRLTRREGWTAAGACVSTNTWTYDSNGGDGGCTVYPGQLYRVTDDEGWQKFSYDVRNRTLQSVRYLTKNGISYTNQFAFDDADRLTSTAYPNGGPVVTNIFDAGLHLSQVKQVGGTSFYTAKGYNELNQLNGVNFGNGAATTFGYYATTKRLKQILTTANGSTTIQSFTNRYDAVSNVIGLQDLVSSHTNAASATISSAVYDDLNRLTTATWSGYGTKTYGYNSVGNVLTNGESGVTNYVYGSIRPHAVRSANGTWFTYDQNGNAVFRGGQRLDYNVNNHLYRVINTNGVVTTFGYDANGARLWEQCSTNTLQVWIGNNYEEKNGQTLYHILANSQTVCTFDKTGTNVFEYYHPDYLTSTSLQTDKNGNQLQHYEYSAFGQTRYTQSINVFKVSRLYTGQVLDDSTGLYYYNFRYYDPILARFMQPDDIIQDIFNPQSYNRYSYCVNNPLRFTDPSGHQAEELEREEPSLNYNSRGERIVTTAQQVQASRELANSAATMRARGLDPSKKYIGAPQAQTQAKPMTETEFAEWVSKQDWSSKLTIGGTAPKVLTLDGDKYPASAANLERLVRSILR